MYVCARLSTVAGNELAFAMTVVSDPVVDQGQAWLSAEGPVSLVLAVDDAGDVTSAAYTPTCSWGSCQQTAVGVLVADSAASGSPLCGSCYGLAAERSLLRGSQASGGFLPYEALPAILSVPVAEGVALEKTSTVDPLLAHVAAGVADLASLLADERWRSTIGADMADQPAVRNEVIKALGRMDEFDVLEHLDGLAQLRHALPVDVVEHLRRLTALPGSKTPLDLGARRLLSMAA